VDYTKLDYTEQSEDDYENDDEDDIDHYEQSSHSKRASTIVWIVFGITSK